MNRAPLTVAQEQEVALRIERMEAAELEPRRQAVARGEGARERRQVVDEVNEDLHLREELVAVGPGELRVRVDEVVVGIFVFQPLAELRVRRIEAVDDLRDDLLLDRREDDLVANDAALDSPSHRAAAERRRHQEGGTRRPGQPDEELPAAHRRCDVGVERVLRVHRAPPGLAMRWVLTGWPLSVVPATTWHCMQGFVVLAAGTGKCGGV
jgi:hypothetical protein